MYRFIFAFFITSFLFFNSNQILAKTSSDFQLFENIFSQWTAAFNDKNLKASCDLFAKNMTADYQGAPTKNYDSICDSFKKVFNGPLNYHYSYKLHQVYRSNDLATVRLTWYLRISKQGKVISTAQDEGIDIFKKDNTGAWKIVNYLAYPKIEQ